MKIPKIIKKLGLAAALFSAVSCGDKGGGSSTPAPITPTNQPPVASISINPTNGYVPQLANLNISNSYDPDGTIVSYKVDADSLNGVNFNTPDFLGTNINDLIKYTYTTQGTRQATVQVKDNLGATSTKTATISIGSGNPVITPIISPGTDQETGNNVQYKFSATDPNGNITDFYFEFSLENKEGTTIQRKPLTGNLDDIVYTLTDNDAGYLTVTAFAKDNDGNSTSYPFPKRNVFLSEDHAQNIIISKLESLMLDSSIQTKPINPDTDITPDTITDVSGIDLHSDAVLRYNSAINSILDGPCSAGTQLHFDFVDKTHEDELQPPQIRYGLMDLTKCVMNDTAFYDQSFVYIGECWDPNLEKYVDCYTINSSDLMPKSKIQLQNQIEQLVRNADDDWNYKPIADTTGSTTFLPTSGWFDIVLDGRNSSDQEDGNYQNLTCKWDTNNDNDFETIGCYTEPYLNFTCGNYTINLKVIDTNLTETIKPHIIEVCP